MPTASPTLSTPTWQWRAFDELAVAELYAVLQLRQAVFVVEQECPYLDADGWDHEAWHLLGWTADDDGAGDGRPVLAAYARVFRPGVKYTEASIGRVITNPLVRRSGMGRALMHEAVRRCELVAPGSDVRIGAQLYLERFYEGFGFRRTSEPYDEDGIAHIEMLRAATSPEPPSLAHSDRD